MNTKISRIVLVLLLMVAIQTTGASANAAQATEGLKIVDLQYQEHGNVHRIILTANLPFMYQTLAAGKGTLVIEADKLDINQISPNYNTAADAVKNISVSNRLGSSGKEVTELIIKYDPSFSYTHSLKGRKLFVEFKKKGFADLTPVVNNGVNEAREELSPKAEVAPVSKAPVRKALSRGVQAKALGLVDINIDRGTSGTSVVFAMNEIVSEGMIKTISLGSPPRFVVDFHGAKNYLTNKYRAGDDVYFKKIRTAQFAVNPTPIARAVFDLTQSGKPVISTNGKNITVTFGTPAIEEAAIEPEVSDEAEVQPVEILRVEDNSETEEETTVEEEPMADPVVSEDEVPASEETESEIKPVSIVPVETVNEEAKPEKTYQESTPLENYSEKVETVKVAPIENTEEPLPLAEEDYSVDDKAFKDQFPDDIKPGGSNLKPDENAFDIPKSSMQDQDANQSNQDDNEDVKLVTKGKDEFETREISSFEQKYTGHLVSLNFANIALRDLISLLGQQTKKNFILDPSVRNEEVSLYVIDMPWDQALDLLLDQYNLGKEEIGNVIHIATQARLTGKAQAKRRLAEEKALAVPVRQITKPVNYAKASDLMPLIRRNLSSKGEIVVDQRTNTLVITDIPSKVTSHLNLIQALDIPTKQVIVEARIVETTRDFINEFGLQYGFRSAHNFQYGNSTGLVFPNQAVIQGGLGGLPVSGTPMAVDVPAQTKTTGILGSFSNISGSFVLDLLLTAAETDKKVRVLSRPRISAANNKQAEIKSGVEVPFQVVQNNTVSIRWREATLKLVVTPHITADDTVIMDVRVDKSSLGIQTIAGFAIQTRMATSTIRVKDGGVAVIGGVLEVSDSVTEESIPVLGKIPFIGRLFKSRMQRTQNTELLIFISPKIIG